jgi:hypothetical protein
MRAPFLLLVLAASAACTDAPPPPDPRQPVSLYLRRGEFVRAEYVDSALMRSSNLELEARTRALDLWREYGAAELDSIVVHVSNRAEMTPVAPTIETRFFAFRSEEFGGVSRQSPVLAAGPRRPVALEIHPGDYLRAEFIDSTLVKAVQLEERRDLFLPLARQVWTEHGAPLDSVIVAVSNYAEPGPGDRTYSPRTTQLRTFKEAELREGTSRR